MTKNCLFVCMGNICRSPAAEGVMRRFAEELRADVRIRSAGTHDYHVGGTPDPRMIAAAAARGYELNSRAAHVSQTDLDPATNHLVIAMDTENHRHLLALAGDGPTTHIRMFSDYLDGDAFPADVPDPYYGDEADFEEVLDILEEGCPIILQSLVGSDLMEAEFDSEFGG